MQAARAERRAEPAAERRIAELPEDYRVVGVERRAPLVRKPSGQIIRIEQDGRVTAATRRPASVSPVGD
jgi:hypothetical protein